MKKKLFAVLTVVLVCSLVLAGCAEPITGASTPYDNIDDLSEAVGFKVLEPPVLPDGYVKSGYYSLQDQVAEILYMNGDNQILYSMSPVKKVESDIEDFDDMYVTTIDGNEATLTLKDGYVVFGTVTIGDYTYSLYCPMGLSSGEFEAIAQYFGKTDEEISAKLLENVDQITEEEEPEEEIYDDTQPQGVQQTTEQQNTAEENDGSMTITDDAVQTE